MAPQDNCNDTWGLAREWSGARIYEFISGNEKIGYQYPICWWLYPCQTEEIYGTQCVGGVYICQGPSGETCRKCFLGAGVGYA